MTEKELAIIPGVRVEFHFSAEIITPSGRKYSVRDYNMNSSVFIPAGGESSKALSEIRDMAAKIVSDLTPHKE